jgi:hypothetical protein
MEDLHQDVSAMRVYSLLIETARRCGVVTYGEIADAAGEKEGGARFASLIGRLFYRINAVEHAAGRPMLSSLVVSKRPDKRAKSSKNGLCACARALGLLRANASEEAIDRFIAEQQRLVYETWA